MRAASKGWGGRVSSSLSTMTAKNRPHCHTSTKATVSSAVSGLASRSSGSPVIALYGYVSRPNSGWKANFQTKAADTRGSSTGTMNSMHSALRQRGVVFWNSSTPSSTATAIVEVTVSTSQTSDTFTEFRKRRSENSCT